MARNSLVESLIGMIVIIVAGMFLFYALSVSGKSIGKDTYTLDAVFGRVDGIATGVDVRIAGIKIGTVTDYKLNTDTYEARLSLNIEGDIPVPEDSVAKVVSDGLLGGAHIALEPGASDVYLANGESITITQGSVDLLGLAVQAFTSNGGNKSNQNEQQNGL